jgi:hypothetical protein
MGVDVGKKEGSAFEPKAAYWRKRQCASRSERLLLNSVRNHHDQQTGRISRRIMSRPMPRTQPTSEAGAYEGFDIYASYVVNATGMHIGTLKVVRKRDKRVLYPFDGCETIGPFESSEDARHAAEALGVRIVEADIANPEP